MTRYLAFGILLVVLLAADLRLRADPPCCDSACCDCCDTCCRTRTRFCKRLCPAGGCHPYGGGLLHWWPRHCFPRCCAPDDYCRKPLPTVCRPCYPPFYQWGYQECCCPTR